MKITIYHNPRCSKSRKTLELIESRGVTPNIVKYLDTPPAPDTLLSLAGLLGRPLKELLRTAESDYAEANPRPPLDDPRRLADWLHAHPQVIERPIVVDEERGRAVIGRPPENVLDLLP